MSDRPQVTVERHAGGKLSDAALETSRLLVEFLHASYATRNLESDAGQQPDGDNGGHAREHGMSSADVSAHAVRAAIHIYQHEERTVGQLASGLGISYGWASRVVEELEAAGYATRERDSDDRRIVRVRLNPHRLEEVERAYEWRGQVVEQALLPLSESDGQAVRIFLRRVTELMLDHKPNGPDGGKRAE